MTANNQTFQEFIDRFNAETASLKFRSLMWECKGDCFMCKNHMSRKLIWNSNELVFENNPSVGVAGISPHMSDVFGEEIAVRWNSAIAQKTRKTIALEVFQEFLEETDGEINGSFQQWCREKETE